MKHDVLQMSAREIAEAIQSKTIGVLDTVNAHIERIQVVNPAINAVITPMFEQARQQAQDADAYIANHGTDNLPSLFGVPVTIKDSWAVDGVRFTGGSSHRRYDIADYDAKVVTLFKNAGAIILGKTNLPDMCWSGETVNPIFGRTNNPNNVSYSAGGSSGGEGAIIAAGGSPLGIGSDIAGSVRIPAAMNGCVSLKPTAGRVPSHDHLPQVAPEVATWNTAGPMARRVEDLALAMDVLSTSPMQNYQDISLQDRRCLVYIHTHGLFPPVRKDVVETISMAAGTLRAIGMDVIRDDTLPMSELLNLYIYFMSKYGNPSFKDALTNGAKYSIKEELNRMRKGNKRISFNVMWFMLSLDVLAPFMNVMGYNKLAQIEKYKQQMLDAMGDGGVILCPLLITAPPKHGWVYRLLTQIPYTTVFNALGFPAVVLPIGYNDKGLPMAVQIVARPNEDEVALAVASELERQYGGWRMARP